MKFAVRPYNDSDLPHAQTALASWIAAAGDCGYCHPGELPHRIYEQLRGRFPVGELVQIWTNAEQIIGLAICFRFASSFDVFVAPGYRRAAVELQMLAAADATTQRLMQHAGCAETTVNCDVFACDANRRRLLESLGFSEYRVWDYITERSLTVEIPVPQLPAGFALRSATPADCVQLAAIRNDAFADDWSAELYRDAVMRKPGYSAAHELIVGAPDGRIAAFTVVRLDPLNRVGLFEPVGTHSAFRRRGLARALMLQALHQMRHTGMDIAMVGYAATNGAAGALYRSLGFRRKYVTLGYRRL